MKRSILKADFLLWLQSKPSDEVIGIAGTSTNTPFVNFVMETQNPEKESYALCEFSAVVIYVNANGGSGSVGRVITNPWARKFISHSYHGLEKGELITVKKVLDYYAIG